MKKLSSRQYWRLSDFHDFRRWIVLAHVYVFLIERKRGDSVLAKAVFTDLAAGYSEESQRRPQRHLPFAAAWRHLAHPRKNLPCLVTAQPSGFESEKQADLGQMSRLLEFVSLLMGGRKGGVRTRKAVKYGPNPAFSDRNGSGLSSYHAFISAQKHLLLLCFLPYSAPSFSRRASSA